ncbi:hypothetical protein NQ117_07090 [Paenibacillus sp. SC116]|uniref:hypothetical protein n=1 Tax=Paenibacillus sp. SC116 TaxID=2968986 RepID=UPI00215B4351|nr:hypothetical protein [Paenibacillus sp. SC116]MCR8843444.1 hypothetical protein [Paenibacillus sp. SC116]
MRIDSRYNQLPTSQQTSKKHGSDMFESALQSAEEKEKKQDDKKGKLVTAREGAYLRQYLVQADGSKVLLSEVKQMAEQPLETGPDSPTSLHAPTINGENHPFSGNTKAMMNLLNFQAGVGAGAMMFVPMKNLDSIGK